MKWTTVVLNCSDPASFWSRLLGGEHSRVTDNFYIVKSGTAWLAAQRIHGFQPPTWPAGDRPKQMHLDVAVNGLLPVVFLPLYLARRR